jgi:hypothetical protein
MFFGVQRRLHDEQLVHRAWPLALAGFLVLTGAFLYARTSAGLGVTPGWAMVVGLLGIAAAGGAWWVVRRSAAIPSTDPEDDPRFRFQGHVARVVQAIESGGGGAPTGRITFKFDDKQFELRACWSPESDAATRGEGVAGEEVVIEFVDGDIAYVESWKVVEERL